MSLNHNASIYPFPEKVNINTSLHVHYYRFPKQWDISTVSHSQEQYLRIKYYLSKLFNQLQIRQAF